jgi:FkbM family methyltransferase
MPPLITKFTKSSIGRIVYAPIQALLHLARRISHPDLPIDRTRDHVFYGDRKFAIEIRRWNVSDKNAVSQCFTQAQYDMPSGVHGAFVERTYREIVASGRKPLIVDCGANIGASVLWFSARYPKAHIVAVEPAPENFALLRNNCRGLDVDVRQAGIGPADGIAWINNPSDAMACRTNDNHDGIAIDVISLGSLLASKPPSTYVPFLLKVDIEGAEKALFASASETFDQFPLIILEPHDWMLPGQQTSVEFLRFHSQAGRELCMKHENIASIAHHPSLLEIAATEPSLVRQ